jgi:hypothetical protein
MARVQMQVSDCLTLRGSGTRPTRVILEISPLVQSSPPHDCVQVYALQRALGCHEQLVKAAVCILCVTRCEYAALASCFESDVAAYTCGGSVLQSQSLLASDACSSCTGSRWLVAGERGTRPVNSEKKSGHFREGLQRGLCGRPTAHEF